MTRLSAASRLSPHPLSPPCRQFTPRLGVYYDNFQVKFPEKSFEIVFVSSDKDEDSFNKYYEGEMPWLALPFEKRDEKSALSKRFKVTGIPTLVIIGPDGVPINTDACESVTEDPEAALFPYAPPTLAEAIGGADFVNGKGNPVTLAELKARKAYVAFYFSAHWCPPCRGFTPQLVSVYKAIQERLGKGEGSLEIIFVSSDRDEDAYKEYFGEVRRGMISV